MTQLNVGIMNPNPSMLGRYLSSLASYNNSFVPELVLGKSGRVELEGYDRVNQVMPVSVISGASTLSAIYLAAGIVLSNGQSSNLQVDATGALRTNPGELNASYDSVTVFLGAAAAQPTGAAHSLAARGLVDSTSGGTIILAARVTRSLVVILNLGAVEISLDPNGGNPSFGGLTTYPLLAGQSLRLTTSKGVKGITASATSASYAVIEEYSP